MCWFKALCSVFIYVGVDWSIGSVLCYQSLWAFTVVVYMFGFPRVVHVIDSCVRPYCSRLFVFCHKLYTYFLCQDWAGKEVARGDIHSKILNWETFNPYLDGLIFGKIWKAHWEKFVFHLGKVRNFLWNFDMIFVENLLLGKIWNWWIWMSILKFLVGKSCWEYSCPS